MEIQEFNRRVWILPGFNEAMTFRSWKLNFKMKLIRLRFASMSVESGQSLSQFFGMVEVAGGELFAILEADYDGIPVCFRLAGSTI